MNVFASSCADKPVKVALPGPYLLTRTMWLDCLRERPYESRVASANVAEAKLKAIVDARDLIVGG